MLTASVHVIPAQMSFPNAFNFFAGKIPPLPPACYDLRST